MELHSHNYVAFKDNVAKLLIKVLELEYEEATIKKLSKALSLSETVVGDIISKLESDPRQFLSVSTLTSDSGTGRPHILMQINPDTLVTNPISAFILLQLAEVSIKNREINRQQFEKMMIDKLKALRSGSEFEVKERIDFLIKIKDIGTDESVPNIIWIDWLRYHAQKPYLHLLANKLLRQNE